MDPKDQFLHPRSRVCGVCARVLDRLAMPDGTVEYAHGLQDQPEDHPAVPIEPGVVLAQSRCDFCSAEDPGWIVPAQDFQLPGMLEGMAGSAACWAACEGCVGFIHRGDWTGLLNRALKAMARKHPNKFPRGVSRQVREEIARIYDRLQENIIGEPFQWPPT